MSISPVNRTEIYPGYMNNTVELKKITNSVDSVRDNPDATIQGITLTGYASPEGYHTPITSVSPKGGRRLCAIT